MKMTCGFRPTEHTAMMRYLNNVYCVVEETVCIVAYWWWYLCWKQ